MNGGPWIHNLDPVFVTIAGVEIRYYGLFFALAMVQGAFIWIWQVRRSGRPWEDALPFIWMGIIGAVFGGRLGNILFYNLGTLLKEPLYVLTNWRGGIASHGTTLGIMAALWIYARNRHIKYLEGMDRVALAIPLGTACVRLGNFMNGEIVGKASTLPWAVIYPAWDRARGLPLTPRHPTQLYEAAMGLLIFVFIYLVDRRLGERRPQGLIVGLFFAGYFTLRFFVEYFKEPHVLDPSFPFTMGQILSVPFAAIGWWLVVTRVRRIEKAPDEMPGAR